MKKAKWMPEEALQIVVKRREAISKGEKDHCKAIEQSNRVGKTRNLFKKLRDTKGIFHAKMSSIQEKNDTALTEAEDIKKRWQAYTEELHKKGSSRPR